MAADIQEKTLLSFLCALALIYIHVPGPFWNLLGSKVTSSDFHIRVQKLEACFKFKRRTADASDILSPDFTGVCVCDGEFQLESELKPAVFQFAAQHPQVKSAL